MVYFPYYIKGFSNPLFNSLNQLKAIAISGHGKMKMNRFIIEHLALLRVEHGNKLSQWSS